MYRVLVPIDAKGTAAEQIVETVLSLPRNPTELEAVVLNVYAEASGGLAVEEKVGSDTGTSPELEREDGPDLPDSVRTVRDHLENGGVGTSLRRERGDPAKQIVSVAEEIDADMIVMSGRKRSPTGKVLFGSVTQSVLLSAGRPVTVVMHEA